MSSSRPPSAPGQLDAIDPPLIDFLTNEDDPYVLCKVPVALYRQLREQHPMKCTVYSSVLTGAKSEVQKKSRYIKGSWTPKEDEHLLELVAQHGKNWNTIANFMPDRVGKQCRERYTNHLDPSVKKGQWTPAEDGLIVGELLFNQESHRHCQWAEIASKLPGRTANSIKNRWNSTLKRKHAGGEQSAVSMPEDSDDEMADVDTPPPADPPTGPLRPQPQGFGTSLAHTQPALPVPRQPQYTHHRPLQPNPHSHQFHTGGIKRMREDPRSSQESKPKQAHTLSQHQPMGIAPPAAPPTTAPSLPSYQTHPFFAQQAPPVVPPSSAPPQARPQLGRSVEPPPPRRRPAQLSAGSFTWDPGMSKGAVAVRGSPHSPPPPASVPELRGSLNTAMDISVGSRSGLLPDIDASQGYAPDGMFRSTDDVDLEAVHMLRSSLSPTKPHDSADHLRPDARSSLDVGAPFRLSDDGIMHASGGMDTYFRPTNESGSFNTPLCVL
eukprot:NODE_914_length_1561_cov_68.595537_g903_i0.p1 GENE.NODE_914_length_1561_cov_68.595537_g903_i0~~NODE_914_length_1561_cov_68.595537_g903_i0.p1  ORF type:complete len:511 (+),score=48.25 NODE_914_length_1561_cov_68.595537_g903_i0:53-1534(+)